MSIQHLVVVSQTTLVATAPPSENVTAPETAPLYVSTTHKLELSPESRALEALIHRLSIECKKANFINKQKDQRNLTIASRVGAVSGCGGRFRMGRRGETAGGGRHTLTLDVLTVYCRQIKGQSVPRRLERFQGVVGGFGWVV